MSKRYRTTIDLLRRTVVMLEGKHNGSSWYSNPNDHPLPTLPDSHYLHGEYIMELAKSEPQLVAEAEKLIAYIDNYVEGKITREGRPKGKER